MTFNHLIFLNSYKANQKLTPLIKLVVSYSQINTRQLNQTADLLALNVIE